MRAWTLLTEDDDDFFPHVNIEFCQNLVQSLRAESLNSVINTSRFTPFHPHCQPCLRGLLCVFVCSLLIYLCYFFAWHNSKTGLFLSKWHLQGNIFIWNRTLPGVALYQKTQLAVFPFVEFSRAFRCRGCRGLCVLYITCGSWQFWWQAEETVEIFQNSHRGIYLQQRHYLKLQIPLFWKSPIHDR